MAAKKGKAISKAKPRSKAKAKLIPAVRYLRYHLTNSGTPGTETSHYIDLARDLSMVNRRMYRQGRDYHIKKITIVSSNTIAGYPGPDIAAQQNAGRVSVSTIPDSWVARGAWNRAYQTWRRMNNEVLKQTAGNITAKWSDFKVYMSNDSRTATLPVPLDNGSTAYLQGEWNYSDLVSPDGTTSSDQFALHMLGDHNGSAGSLVSVGLIKSYGDSRATVNSQVPNVPGDLSEDPLLNVFDYGTTIDEVANLIEGENDNPPYDIDDYPGADANGAKPLVVQDSAISAGRASLSGFTALLGLLELEITSPVGGDVYSVLIELAPGKFRGIKAESV